jgi:rhodanese-related sulfurtransferase
VIVSLDVARFMNRRVSIGRERETGGRATRQRRTTAARRANVFSAAATRARDSGFVSRLGRNEDSEGVKDMKKKSKARIVGVLGNYAAIAFIGIPVGFSSPIRADEQTATDAPHVIPRLKLEEFRGRHAAGSVLVVDVRDEFVFKAGHIPGAMNVPLGDIDRRAGEIRARAGGRRVVTYCSCPSEQTAASAAVTLAKSGVPNVSVLVGGYPEWIATGGAVERGGGD